MSDALLADLEVINSLVKARVISIKAKGLVHAGFRTRYRQCPAGI